MLQLMEYIFSDEMLKLLDHFTSFTRVRIAFFSLNGEELCMGKNESICRYCTMRRQNHAFNEACLADDQHGRDVSLEKNGAHFYLCHAGLCQAVMPFRVAGGPTIGYVMIGQFRLAGIPTEARNTHELQALEELPVFSREKIDDLLILFEVLIQHITNHALVSRRDFDLLGPLIERMRKDPAEALTLPAAARLVGLSPSRLSHLFSSTMGISFKRYQTAQRLELADRLLKTNSNWRIARVAEACGFDDPLYFSRVYKENRGFPPSKALQKSAYEKTLVKQVMLAH